MLKESQSSLPLSISGQSSIDEEVVGDVSRCIFSPRLNKNIGFASINVEHAKPGTIPLQLTLLKET